MNMRLISALLVLSTSVAVAAETATAPATAPAAVVLKTDQQKIGYAIGQEIGGQIAGKIEGLDVDHEAVAAGIRDAVTHAKSQMSEKEMDDTLDAFDKKMMAEQDSKRKEQEGKMKTAGEANQKTGTAFLADNAKKDGVKTTATGLQYKVIKAGTGKSPKATDTVSVNYKGTLISGSVFDQSKTPVQFPVNGVISGWTEALQLMMEGDKWQLFIPSKLAYGERGTPGGPIGPNEVLIFDVELLEVK